MISYMSTSYPDCEELLQGCTGFIANEKRDTIYKIALHLISEAQWEPEKLAEGLGVLLLTWNAAFYTRYGSFDFDVLEGSIEKRLEDLKTYSKRNILSYTKDDDVPIQQLFKEILEATKSVKKEARTPVGTAKALHLLAPEFFSIWDDAIAKKYEVYWIQGTDSAPQLYTKFQYITLQIANNVLGSYEKAKNVPRNVALQYLCEELYPRIAIAVYSSKPPIRKSLVKMIDEYNYAKYRLRLDLNSYREIVSKVISSQ